jgi:hypothetical protein|tara:strand:- start:1325 stop:1681 length:357 start_codon:yes stop_codon:yes gene_type:complete
MRHNRLWGKTKQRTIMTLTAKLMGTSSPYIFNIVYDIDVRLLFIEFLDDPSDEQPSLRIIFPEITLYSETNQADAIDDELMDDLVSMDWVSKDKVAVITCKKEILIELTGEPFSEKIS